MPEGFTSSELFLKCCVCGKSLSLNYEGGHKKGNRPLCLECFLKSKKNPVEELQSNQDKQELFEEIKRDFNITEVPIKFIEQVDKLIKSDSRKNYASIRYTLYYATQICGFVPEFDYGITGIISMFYEEAAKFYKKTMDISQENTQRVLTNRQKNVIIKKTENTRFSPKSKIEDL